VNGRRTAGVDVIFCVEHVDRELHAVRSIAAALAQRGVTSLITSIFFDTHVVRHADAARVVVLPFVMNTADWPTRLFHESRGQSAIYVNLNWEQLLSPANRAYKAPRSDFQRRIVWQCAWDDQFATYLQSHRVECDNIFITGNLADDLLVRRLAERRRVRSALATETGLTESRPWLFFPTNHAWAFTSDRLIRSRIAAGYDPDVAWAYQSYSRRCFDVFASWLRQAALSMSDRQFIVRPHPSVSTEQYRDRIRRVAGPLPPNVLLSRTQTVREWLSASDAVFSSWSTTAWDAHRAGIPAFLMTPYPRPAWLNVAWNDVLPNLATADVFLAAVAAARVRPAGSSSAIPAGAIERHADLISRALASGTPSPRSPDVRLTLPTRAKLAKVRLYGRLFSIRRLGTLIDRELSYDYFEPEIVEPSGGGGV
jgi:surface carbohydrate biosynthesis protein